MSTANAVISMCEKCGVRPGNKTWVGESGGLAWAHGLTRLWCERCCVEAQLTYARERAARIPELEQRLRALIEGDTGTTNRPDNKRGGLETLGDG